MCPTHLAPAPACVQESVLQGGSSGAEPQLQQLLAKLQSSLQGAADLDPQESLGGAQAALAGMQAQLGGIVQVVGAAVQPGASPSSSALLESR